MFALVTVLAVWLASNVNQVHQRNELLAYLRALENQPNPARSWVLRSDPKKLPRLWRLMGAEQDWATWLICNPALTDAELKRARALLPDCTIEVHDP